MSTKSGIKADGVDPVASLKTLRACLLDPFQNLAATPGGLVTSSHVAHEVETSNVRDFLAQRSHYLPYGAPDGCFFLRVASEAGYY